MQMFTLQGILFSFTLDYTSQKIKQRPWKETMQVCSTNVHVHSDVALIHLLHLIYLVGA